ncbi:MoaB/Mog domain-containing protein [Jimgerdemannia flammicorona]|uniref:MoaB/Mog domain-containing protein n=1 Tax=Jimgerdemannia flammicorona TaxID=994334 RepID=A0A433AE20_9FUNG|nr:MoaB/Mog domain-containing protein [Jimgerdemannia flammicorona]
MSTESPITVGILTISDTASNDPSQDQSGPTLRNILSTPPVSWVVAEAAIVPDNPELIKGTVVEWCDKKNLDIVMTTGGTGFASRDVTPEAITSIIERPTPGITHVLLSTSLSVTPFAALSRPVAGIRSKTLILTLPGSPKACKENVGAVLGMLPHAVELLRGGTGKKLHDKMQGKEPEGRAHRQHDHHHHDHHHPHREHSERHESGHLSQLLDEPVTRRLRKSPYPMIPVSEAIRIVALHTQRLEQISRPVDESLIGSVLAEDVLASEPVPGYRASIVDGYAVIATDGPGTYPVVSVSLAAPSTDQPALVAGQIARIATGGPVPSGATAVVMVEDTTLELASEDGQKEEMVRTIVTVAKGENVREVGSDCAVGELVAHKGTVVSAVGGEVGVLASVGIKEVSMVIVCIRIKVMGQWDIMYKFLLFTRFHNLTVTIFLRPRQLQVPAFRKPKVGILSTGMELVDHTATSALAYGQIRDTNRPTLLAAVRAAGFEAKDLGIAPDSADELEKALRDAMSDVDVVVTTGGVSMGEMDLLKPILEQRLGATIHFGRILMKPGKPTTFATVPSTGSSSENLFFALPGNPVSATVTFYLFVLPALRKMAGFKNWELPVLKVQLLHNIRLDLRPEYHRAILSIAPRSSSPSPYTASTFVARSTGHQQSSRMLSMLGANALLRLPPRDGSAPRRELLAGTVVDAVLIGQIEI